MVSCCSHKKQEKTCKRKSDGKVFNLPRRFSRKKCMEKIKGFTMRSSCAPYLECKKNKNKIKNKPSNKTKENNMQFIKALLNKNANQDIKDNKGGTPLIIAIYNNHSDDLNSKLSYLTLDLRAFLTFTKIK